MSIKTYYIEQNMKQTSDIKHLLDFDNLSYYVEEKNKNIVSVNIEDILSSNNKRYMIVAEPGYGKTRLLKEIVIRSAKEAFFVDAKRINHDIINSIKRCNYFDDKERTEEELQSQKLFKNTNGEDDIKLDDETIVCIDALDEVPFDELYDLFEKIEDFVNEYQGIKLIISCRTHHLKKITYDIRLFEFQYIDLKPFSGNDIKSYLENVLQRRIDLDELYRKSKMSNISNFISTPRYLYYFSQLLETASLDEIINLSRAKMFDEFIYRKLDKELKDKTPQSQRDLLKRVLEKLALIMKINQVSTISKDDLMNIFDQMDSNFSQIAFRDDLLQKLYDRSLLKDNIDSIEFENQEFLDYLSAKELVRFEKVEQTFFDIAIDAHLNEVYVTWFYVLPFIFELKPFLLEMFLDYLDKNFDRALSKKYFETLLSIEADSLDIDVKSRIFDMVFDYHSEHNKWLNSHGKFLSYALARYYDESKYAKILESVDEKKYNTNELYVKRTNAVELIEALISLEMLEEEQLIYWKSRLTKWLKFDPYDNRNLHENIVASLAIIAKNDLEWIKSLYFIFENGVEVQNSYAYACYRVAPNDIFSVNVYLARNKFYKKNRVNKHLRTENEYKYILRITDVDILIYAFDKIFIDEMKIHRLSEKLDRYSYDEEIPRFKNNLMSIYNEKLSKVLIKLVDNSFNIRDRDSNKLYKNFVEVLVEKESSYLKHLIKTLHSNYNNKVWSLQYNEIYITRYINENNINMIMQYLDIFEEDKIKVVLILYYKVDDKIKKKIEELYPNETEEENKRWKDAQQELGKNSISICDEWKEKIEPEPNKYSTDLFSYFNSHKGNLLECPEYKNNYDKTVFWAKNVLDYNNPLDGKIEKKGTSATVYNVHYFENCIEFIDNENIELTQQMIDNVFKYLPFDMNSNYERTLNVAKKPSKKAIQDIADVYAGKREDDLGIYHTRGFIELYKRKAVKEFEPILLSMLGNKNIEHTRETIIDILPSRVLTKKMIREYMTEFDKNDFLYEKYLCILLSKYHDKDAIEEAMIWVKNKAENEVMDDNLHPEPIAFDLSHSNYSIEKDKELLFLTVELANRDKKANGNFLRNIVSRHITYIIEKDVNEGLFAIQEMEKFISKNRDKKDLHWFEYSLVELKEAYLSQRRVPDIIGSVKKYNELMKKDYLSISSPLELLEVIKMVIDKDIRSWIEDDGAYKHINELAKKRENINAEDFIQKSIKNQIELAFLKKGFRETDFTIIREEQLLDDKRLDFRISYGLIGSVVLELKLSHNSEAIASRENAKQYVSKLESYIKGSNSDFGLFVIFNIEESKEKFNKNIASLIELYDDEENITVIGLDCIYG